MALKSLPRSAQKIFWSCDFSQLDKEKHREYIIHQVLQYGDLNDFKWLEKIYSLTKIKNTFVNRPRSTYQPQTFNFVKNYLLKISDSIDKENYVKFAL
ncbi:MAG: DUF6922 domain-containing protein [Patescibacteria group bacterium]